MLCYPRNGILNRGDEMTKQQAQILKYLYGNKRTVLDVVRKFKFSISDNEFTDFYRVTLPIDDYMHIEHKEGSYIESVISLNEQGQAFVESERDKHFDKYFTRIIAVAALVISLIALLKP